MVVSSKTILSNNLFKLLFKVKPKFYLFIICLSMAGIQAPLLSAEQLAYANIKAYAPTPLAQNVSSYYVSTDDPWLAEMSYRLKPFIKDYNKRILVLTAIKQEAKRFDLSPQLVLALIQTESTFRPTVTSNAGAHGLMQIMPFWKKTIGNQNDDLSNIATNIYYGCAILRIYLNREKGNVGRALARYNGSLGKTKYPKKVFKHLRQYWL